MKSISTDDCKKFIVQFQKDNPLMERIRFGIESHEDIKTNPDLEFLSDVLNEKNWKRIFKRKPESHSEAVIYVSGQPFNRFVEPTSRVKFEDIKCVRGFDMNTADGQIAYLVLEMKDGTLHLGDYIGD